MYLPGLPSITIEIYLKQSRFPFYFNDDKIVIYIINKQNGQMSNAHLVHVPFDIYDISVFFLSSAGE